MRDFGFVYITYVIIVNMVIGIHINKLQLVINEKNTTHISVFLDRKKDERPPLLIQIRNSHCVAVHVDGKRVR